MFESAEATGHTLHNWIELSSSKSQEKKNKEPPPIWISVVRKEKKEGLTLFRNIGGRGYVSIDNADEFDFLPKAFDLNMNATHTTPVYMMSVFHQLHCLVSDLLIYIPKPAFETPLLSV